MPKVNVYLPDELAASVKSCRIALSAVCQQALEAEVVRTRGVRRGRRDAAQVAARLMATEAAERERKYLQGLELGTRWAKEHATLSDLRSVARLQDRPGVLEMRDAPSLLTYLLSGVVGFEVEPDSKVDVEADRLAAGLVDGAAEVYRAVLPHLRAHAGVRPTKPRHAKAR